jgi:hypothetical protein
VWHFPIDLVLRHIAPHTIHSFGDALCWMQTCSKALEAAKTQQGFWEPFLQQVVIERVAWFRVHDFGDVAALIEKHYIM